MKLENNIGWCDATTNAVTGCDKVSPGCKNCYAEAGTRARVLRARGVETWGPKGKRVPVNFEPVFRRLNKLCICDQCHEAYPFFLPDGRSAVNACCGLCGGNLRRIRLFADSNSDWLDPQWPVETLARFLDAIRLAPNIDVQLLTKRIEYFDTAMLEVFHCEANIGQAVREFANGWRRGREVPRHVWLGVSVENQDLADERIPQLLKTPAAVRFASVEPLLGPVHLNGPFDGPQTYPLGMGLNWVIVGGESGPKRRPCDLRWLCRIVEDCRAHECPVFVKQDCAALPGRQGRIRDDVWKLKQFPAPVERTRHNFRHLLPKTHDECGEFRACIPTSGAVNTQP